MSEEQNIRVIKRMVDLVNQQKISQLAELTHPNFKRHDLAGALPEVSGADGPVNLVQMVLRGIPDIHYEIVQEDIGFGGLCQADALMASSFNSMIGFSRTKTLMMGDDCCNHVYYLKTQ